MPEFTLHPSLEELTEQSNNRLQLRHELLNQIGEQFQDVLHDQELRVSLVDQSPSLDPSLFNSHFSSAQKVKDIKNIAIWVTPYLSDPKKQVLYLDQASNATFRETVIASWQPNGFSQSNLADANQGRLTGIAHPDFFQGGGSSNYVTASLEYVTKPLPQDLDELAIAFNYMFGYAAGYEMNTSANSLYCQQEVRLTLKVYELDTLGNPTIRPHFPYNEVLVKFERKFISPPASVHASDLTVQQPQRKLQYFTLLQPKKDRSYRIIFDLYVFAWPNNGRLSTEGNLVMLPWS